MKITGFTSFLSWMREVGKQLQSTAHKVSQFVGKRFAKQELPLEKQFPFYEKFLISFESSAKQLQLKMYNESLGISRLIPLAPFCHTDSTEEEQTLKATKALWSRGTQEIENSSEIQALQEEFTRSFQQRWDQIGTAHPIQDEKNKKKINNMLSAYQAEKKKILYQIALSVLPSGPELRSLVRQDQQLFKSTLKQLEKYFHPGQRTGSCSFTE